MKTLTLLIKKELHTKFKIRCAEVGITMTDVLIELIQEWIESSKRGKK